MSQATMCTWHIITCEYPPEPGGVSDYTEQVAHGLADAGDVVHVWCRRDEAAAATWPAAPSGATVHHATGRFTPKDLDRLGASLDRHPTPRRLLVQWVPHGYGARAMNLPFCLWLLARARRHGDHVELVAHETFLPYAGSWRQRAAALVQRVMTAALLAAAARVWVTIPAWEDKLRPYAFGRALPFRWLPVPSNVPVVDEPARVAAVRARIRRAGGIVVGHFGTYGRYLVEQLVPLIVAHLTRRHTDVILLLGRGGDAVRERVAAEFPDVAARVYATGALDASTLSLHLQACDVMLQPYSDGVSTRRGSAMAALAHGLPVVTTLGSLTEAFWSGSRAVAFAADDHTGLSAALRRVVDDAAERARLGAAARALYRERFAVEHTVAALREQPHVPCGSVAA